MSALGLFPQSVGASGCPICMRLITHPSCPCDPPRLSTRGAIPSPAPITGQVTCPPALQERTVSHQLRPGPGPRPAQARTQAGPGQDPGRRGARSQTGRVTAAWPGKPGYNAQVPHAIIRASKGHQNYPTAQFPQNIIRKKRQTHFYMLSFRNSITHCDAIEATDN